MNNQAKVLEWGTDYLTSKGYSFKQSPIIMVATPWSKVIRFSTSKGYIYLKQAPPPISVEPKIFQLLADQFQANVPFVIAINEDLHCFLMKDAGQTLREYLKTDFQPNLLCQAIKHYTALQRSTENHIEPFLAMGIPDWRLDKLPLLYDNIINQVELLKSDGLTEKELQILQDLSPQFSAQCELLSQYQIPETIAIYDFNTNNVLIEPNTKNITCIDLGEAVITHPFLSLHTYLHQATIHHSVKELDQTYYELQEACFENWLRSTTKTQLLAAFILAKKLWPIYSVLSMYQLINIIGLQAFNSYHAKRPHRITRFFKEYILSEKQT
ncbi:MAG: aminoglycoside phosphotransferase family protein [Pseudomonadota bacterium]|nr:aminoglycoside phosphotransferase family protein [Pseudomonadota bacterium]